MKIFSIEKLRKNGLQIQRITDFNKIVCNIVGNLSLKWKVDLDLST